MKDWPAGSHLTFECSDAFHKAGLIAVGYKYSSKNVSVFIATKGAGHTTKGSPYEAKYPDAYHNQVIRDIPRPEVVSIYYGGSNEVDVHNQERQSELRLEKHWKTTDGFFRIATTMIGICVTDTWLAVRNGVSGNSRYANMPINQFADLLSKELVDRQWQRNAKPATSLLGLSSGIYDGCDVSALTEATTSPSNSRSVVTSPSRSGDTVGVPNSEGVPFIPACFREQRPIVQIMKLPGQNRAGRKNCCNEGCGGKKTRFFCFYCKKGYCKDSVEKKMCCYTTHICKAYKESAESDTNFDAAYHRWEAARRLADDPLSD